MPLEDVTEVRPKLGEGSTARLPVGTVTLLLGDLGGSVRAWDADPAAMTVIVRRLDALVTETVGRYGGVRLVEQGEGDSFAAAFTRATDALGCAVDLQRALQSQPAQGKSTARMRLALHTGEMELEDNTNSLGAAIDRCARLRDLAHGGQILATQTTGDLLSDALPEDVRLRDLGSHPLHDLPRRDHVYEVCPSDLRREYPPLRSVEPGRDSLPVRLTTFIGRDAEQAELERLLESSRLVVVTGAGGCGKTRLAVEVAGRLADQFSDGARFVDLASITDPKLVAETMLSAIDMPRGEGRPASDALVDVLAEREMLVVLDNCEQLVEACGRVATEILTACPQVTILATSREPLDVEGEVAWRLPSLSVPTTRDLALEGAATSEAVRLFVDRASSVRAGFALTDANWASVVDICRRVDGIPLAIELVAARTRLQSPAEIAATLEHRLHSVGSRRNSSSRHATLAASLDWSYDLLSAEEQIVLRRLSVFHGGFTLELAEQVTAGSPVDGDIVFELLGSLVDKSLVVVDERDAVSRFEMLEMTRQHAAARLRMSVDDEVDTRNRHLAAFIALAEETEPRISTGRDRRQWLDRIEREHANMRAALEWSRVSGQAESRLRLAGGLAGFWTACGYWREGNELLRDALAAAPAAPQELRAKALIGVAQFTFPGSDREGSLPAATEALAILRDAGDPRGVVKALRVVGLNQLFDDPAAAMLALEQAADVARSSDDALMVADLLISSSLARFLCGDFAKMREDLEGSIRIGATCASNSRVLGNAFVCLAAVLTLEGQIQQAQEAVERGLSELEAAGDAFWPVFGRAVLGDIHSLRGLYAEAHSELENAAEQGRAYDSPVIIGLPLYFAGRMALALGDPGRARVLLEEAVSLARAVGVKLFLSWSLRELGLASWLAGDQDAAVEQVGEALAVAQAIGADQPRAFALYGLGFIAQHRGDPEEAESLWHEALRLQLATGDIVGVIDTLEALSAIAGTRDSLEEAARLFGATEAAREVVGYWRPGPNEEHVETQRQRVRRGLEPVELAQRWAEGRALSLEEAGAYASRARGERKRPTSGWESLTPTELEVVRLVAEGLTNKAIAERLFVAASTVKTHVSNAFAKLGVTTRSALTAEAVRRGM